MEALPHTIEGYEILRELHRGGQGVVYVAIQESTKRKVAIKDLLEGPYASEAAKKRFEREIELVAALKHPNIISIFHSGEATDQRQYFVMDYVRGLPLDKYLSAIKTFQNAVASNATHVSRTDVEPLQNGEQINLLAQIADVLAIIKGFQGDTYNQTQGGPELAQCP